jgi:site-specific recombinase XerD
MFVNIATNWFKYHKLISTRSVQARPFDLQLARFLEYLKLERKFSLPSLALSESIISSFLGWAWKRRESISAISLSDVDGFIKIRREAGCKSATIAAELRALRTFFHFCESQRWSDSGVSHGIRIPRLRKPTVAPKSLLKLR